MSARVLAWLLAGTMLRVYGQAADGEGEYKAGVKALNQGQYAEALEHAGRAEQQFQATGKPARVGFALNLAGLAYLNQGGYAKALPLFTGALRIAEEFRDVSAETVRLNNIGNLHFFRGEYLAALRRYEAALARVRGAPPDAPWRPAREQLTLHNLAALYQALGQDRRALDYFKEVAALPGQMQQLDQAQALTNLGVVFRRLGDPYKALATYERAGRMLAGAPQSAAAVHLLHNTGIVQALDLGDYDAALATFTRSLATARAGASEQQQALDRLLLGETHLRRQRTGLARAEFAAALEIATRLHLADEHWRALYGLGRVQRLEGQAREAQASLRAALALIESSREDLGTPTLKTEFLSGKRDVYDALIGLLLDGPSPDSGEVLRLMEQSRARNLKDARMGSSDGRPPSVAQVQSALDGATIVLNYWHGPGRLAAVWITRHSAGLVQRQLAPGADRQFIRFQQAAANPAAPDWQALSGPLSALLLEPAAEALATPGLRQLILNLDGALPLLPFDLLRAGPQRALLVEQFAIWQVPSLDFLTSAAMAPPAPRRWPWQPQLVAFADPVETAASLEEDRLPADNSRTRLAAAPEEARAVARLLPGAGELHVGEDNRKQWLLQPRRVPPAVLHFATHAVVDQEDSRRSRLIFSPAAGQPGSRYLFAGEVAQLNLAGVDLVTLAACDTEGGRLVRGEGIDSLGRAFLARGAAATVTSLWRVSDQATAQLMQQFYFQLGEGTGKAEALRQAKLAILRRGGPGAHPHRWAGFVLSGSGASALPPAWGWRDAGIATAWAFALTAAALAWRKRGFPAKRV
ncbi:MAG: CHAT domain-containing protein [Bryobacterales bacterium]|nr:CHAT domain-containing protein [Bryobacterales bacterium]